MNVYSILVLLSFSAAAYAQQQVPEIPYDSVPNFLKLPTDLYLGEAAGVAVNSKGHVFVLSRGNTTGRPMALPRPNCSSLVPTGSTFAKSAKTCTPGLLLMPSALTGMTTSGLSIRDRT